MSSLIKLALCGPLYQCHGPRLAVLSGWREGGSCDSERGSIDESELRCGMKTPSSRHQERQNSDHVYFISSDRIKRLIEPVQSVEDHTSPVLGNLRSYMIFHKIYTSIIVSSRSVVHFLYAKCLRDVRSPGRVGQSQGYLKDKD